MPKDIHDLPPASASGGPVSARWPAGASVPPSGNDGGPPAHAVKTSAANPESSARRSHITGMLYALPALSMVQIRAVDGRLEVEPAPTPMRLVRRGKGLSAVSARELPELTAGAGFVSPPAGRVLLPFHFEAHA